MGKKLGSARYQVLQHIEKYLDDRNLQSANKPTRHELKKMIAEQARVYGFANSPQNKAERMGITSNGSLHNIATYGLESFNYVREHFGIKDLSLVPAWAVGVYMDSKIEELKIKGGGMVNKDTVDNIASYMVKFWGVGADRAEGNSPNNLARLADLQAVKNGELAAMRVANMQNIDHVRLACDSAKADHADSFYKNEQARAYDDPRAMMVALKLADHQLAYQLISEQGFRASEVSLIKAEQLSEDNKLVWKGKGKQMFMREISADSADRLREAFVQHGKFEIDQRAFRADLRQASEKTGQEYNGIHGLHWNFAQERYDSYIAEGMEHKEALQATSQDLGHHRPEITEHYLQRR